ncbi:MAG: hypothetical protein ACRCTW_11160 [Lactococcus garvieae]
MTNSVYNYVVCKVEIHDKEKLRFKSTLIGRYLVGKDGAIESMVESLEDRYGNRSKLINKLKEVLMLNCNTEESFNNHRLQLGGYTYVTTYHSVSEQHYQGYTSLETWGDISLE